MIILLQWSATDEAGTGEASVTWKHNEDNGTRMEENNNRHETNSITEIFFYKWYCSKTYNDRMNKNENTNNEKKKQNTNEKSHLLQHYVHIIVICSYCTFYIEVVFDSNLPPRCQQISWHVYASI